MTAPGLGVPHGTLSGYSYRRCRCEDCRVAWTDYCRTRREQIQSGLTRVGTHGRGGYSQGCRCDVCAEGQRASRGRTAVSA